MNPSADPSAPPDERRAQAHRRFWRSTLRLTAVLLAVWAIAGLGCGVLLADHLSGVRLGGFPLGFWFAQQGSLIVFLFVILAYTLAMGRLDRRLKRELLAAGPPPSSDAARGGAA